MTEKKQYEAPQVRVHQVKQRNIICTSPEALGNEQYESGSTDGWY